MNNQSHKFLAQDQYPQNFIPFPDTALEGTLVDRFEAMVCSYPTNIAVTDQGQIITYRELNAAANSLAWKFLSQCGQSNERIAFFAGFEKEAAIITWGILKAGKTYIVMNPDHPADMLVALLMEAEITFLVSINKYQHLCEDLQERLPGLTLVHFEQGTEENKENPNLQIHPDVIPYINYTSGTTGKPKLLIHENRGLLQQQLAKINDFGIVATDHWAQLNPFSFGGGGFSFFGAMSIGACVCVYDMLNSGLSGIADWLRGEGITIINMPPPVFRNIFGNLAPEQKFPDARIVLLGGDTMINRDVQIFNRHFSPSCVLVNYLGLTEVGIATRYFVDTRREEGPVIPVGYPFKGVEISIIDENGSPLPAGMKGEIVLKTRYITRNPALRPDELSENRFVIDTQTGWTSVRSGDLGQIREDGALEHLGRKDSIIKVRGLRIDTAEIEAVLYQNENVQDVVVTARGTDSLREWEVVAYIIPKPNSDLTIAQLYGFLSWKLPQYMIPSRYVFLEKLPLSSNGKLDKNKLPEPDRNKPILGEKFTSPRNLTELQLAEIWSDLLNIKRISIHDNFFTLGGHSLLAAQLLEQVERKFKVTLPMQSMAKYPTLAGMAGMIAELAPRKNFSSVTILREGNDGDAANLFFIPGGARSGISVMNLATFIKLGYKVYALEYPGMDGYLEPLDDIRDFAKFFINQIRTIQPEGPYLLGGLCVGGVIVFEMAKQLVKAGEEVELLFLLDSTPPGGDPTLAAKKRSLNIKPNRTSFPSSLGKVQMVVNDVKARLGRNRMLLRIFIVYKHILDAWKKSSQEVWQERRMDKRTRFIFDKIWLAEKSYQAEKYHDKAIIVFNAVSEGTGREKNWTDLLDSSDVFYIPGTSHFNIFTLDTSIERMAEIINSYLS